MAATGSETSAFIGALILAAIVAAGLIGVAVSALYGADLKQACILGGIFVAIHIGISLAFHFLL